LLEEVYPEEDRPVLFLIVSATDLLFTFLLEEGPESPESADEWLNEEDLGLCCCSSASCLANFRLDTVYLCFLPIT